MKKRLAIAPIVLLSLSACTVESQGADMKSEFHPPLTYAQWESESVTTRDGEPACAITSGYNGVSVYARKKPGGILGISVESNRALPPGSEFKINVGEHTYRTSQAFFPAGDSVELVQDFSVNEKAYLEWSELHVGGKGRQRYTNILKLEGFNAQFEQCKKRLLGEGKRPQEKK